MTPADQHALREALATWFERRFPLSRWQAEAHAQAMILPAGPLAPYLAAEAERDAIAKRDAHEFALRGEPPGDPWEMVRHLEEQCRLFIRQRDEWKAVADQDQAARFAAEAENTRLKETVEAMGAALKPLASEGVIGLLMKVPLGSIACGHIAVHAPHFAETARSVLATIPQENPDA